MHTPNGTLLITLLTALWAGGDEASQHPPVVGLDRQASASEDGRREHFVLLMAPEQDASPVQSAALFGAPRVVGCARLRSVSRPLGLSSELELELIDAELRVHHIERPTARGPKLVWRELSAGGGRTVLLEWDASLPGLRSTEWSGGEEAVRRELEAEGLQLPLELQERERVDASLDGWQPVFDPLSGRVELRRPVQVASILRGGLRLRRVSWIRRDGTPAGERWYLGARLLAQRWQEGGPIALAVSQEEYAHVLRWGREGRRP